MATAQMEEIARNDKKRKVNFIAALLSNVRSPYVSMAYLVDETGLSMAEILAVIPWVAEKTDREVGIFCFDNEFKIRLAKSWTQDNEDGFNPLEPMGWLE